MMRRLLPILLLLSAAAGAGTIDPADFTVAWTPPRRGITWATVTHTPSGRSFRLKAAKCVTDVWLASADPAAARSAWIGATAKAYLERVLYEESAEGIRERLLAEAKQHKENVLAAQAWCEALKLKYPAYADRIPTITVTGGD